MNYLAHLFLADFTPESLLGKFLGDFTKGSLEGRYTAEIRKGIQLHRRVDCYTDSHPIFISSKRRINGKRRRVAGIMIDIFYDHFLAKNWGDYSERSLTEFSQFFYQVLQEYQTILPDSLQRVLPRIIQEDWLRSYQDITAIEGTLKRVAMRMKHPTFLAEGGEDLRLNYLLLEADFRAFFPELREYVQLIRHWS